MKQEDIKKSFKLKKSIPVFIVTIMIAGSAVAYRLISNNIINNRSEDSNLINRETWDIAEVKDQFKIQNRNYIILSEEQKKDFGFPDTIKSSDIGSKITTISNSVDGDLKGREVYKYLPADGEAVVALKMDNEYNLYKFLAFDSYNNNQDEDARAYLKLYGINSAEDIGKIQFIGHSDEAKIEGKLDLISEITESERIAEFYNYYSVIKNSSDNYFNKLFNFKGSNNESKNIASEPTKLPPDYVEGEAVDSPEDEPKEDEVHYAEDNLLPGDTKSSDTPAVDKEAGTGFDKGVARETSSSSGTAGNALNNSLAIRIYNQKGLYLEAEYYPNIGFISRHEVNDDFAIFLKDCIGY